MEDSKHKLSNIESGESLRWRRFDIGSDGFVCLVDWMGDDNSICEAARVCYGRDKRPVSDNKTLIHYLMRHHHETPFEMCELKFLIRVPMDTWRQFVRHRTASINETSTRYAKAIDSANTTAPDEWRKQSEGNKQGSDGQIPRDVGERLSKEEKDLLQHVRDVYNSRIEAGVAREQARKDLTLSNYTEAYWKIDLRNMLHFLELRLDNHAQQEIRAFAKKMADIVAKLFPITYHAFSIYRTGAVTLSVIEVEAIKQLFELHKRGVFPTKQTWRDDVMKYYLGDGEVNDYPPPEWMKDKCRERDEWFAKMQSIGFME